MSFKGKVETRSRRDGVLVLSLQKVTDFRQKDWYEQEGTRIKIELK